MKLKVCVFALVCLLCSIESQAQVRPFNPMADSARLFSGPWRAETLIRVDSMSGDSLPLVAIRDAALIAPGRILFLGLVGRTRHTALMSWINGRIKVLARVDQDVVLADGGGRFRFNIYTVNGARLFPGKDLLYVNITGDQFRRGGAVYATDGERWLRILGRGDSVTLRGRRSPIGGANIIGMDADRNPVMVTFSNENRDAILRRSGDQLEPLVVTRDTISGAIVSDLNAAIIQQPSTFPEVRNSFSSAPNGRWSAMVPIDVRGREWYLVGSTEGGATRRILATTDTLAPESRPVVAIAAEVLSDGRLVVQTGNWSLFAGAPGNWNVLLRHPDSLPERSDRYHLAGAERISENELVVLLYQSITNRPFYSVFLAGASGLVPLKTDSTAAAALEWLRKGFRDGRFLPQAGFRRVPGYDGRLMLRLIGPFRGGMHDRAIELFVDPVNRMLRAVPTIPVAGRPGVGLDAIIGWNSENEAVALLASEVVVLRKP